MNVQVGQVISKAWTLFKSHFWPMIGMNALYFALTIGLFLAFFIAIGSAFSSAFALGGGGFDGSGPSFSTIIGGVIVFYAAFLMLIFSQNASLVSMVSPIEKLAFGEAVARGFRASVTLLPIFLGFLLLQFIVLLIIGFVFSGGAMFDPAVTRVANLILFPFLAYFGCRFVPLVPIVAVEKVYNPIKVVDRAWEMTSGKALGIFVVLVVASLVTFALFAVPTFMISAAEGAAGGASNFVTIMGVLLTFPILWIVMSFISAIMASLHEEITDFDVERLADVFE